MLHQLADPDAVVAPQKALRLIILCGMLHGAIMASFRLDTPERWLLVLFGAIKTPMLILCATALCLPAFFVINTVLGLRRDFALAARCILCGQAALTAALASLGPFVRFLYFCGLSHRWAVLSNAFVFALCTLVAHTITLRRYRPLLAISRAHRFTLWFWVVSYAFVGTQLGWMLRPFIGTPGKPAAFLRDEPFSNAYVVIAKLILGGL